MPSERIQRRIDSLLDEADAAVTASDWTEVAEKARAVLAIDATNEDAAGFLKMAEANGVVPSGGPQPESTSTQRAAPQVQPLPVAFGNGRYRVSRLLGEGGRKQVYLARDTTLDRDVALAVLRTEGLDAGGRERVTREARAMARMGAHAQLVTIFDISENPSADSGQAGQPFLVEEYMTGGDLAGLLAGGPLDLDRTLAIGRDITRDRKSVV